VLAITPKHGIAALYAVEKDIRGHSGGEHRTVRQQKSRPLVDALEPWLRAKLGLISQKSKLAEATRYALSRWEGLTRFIDDGRIELDNNTIERSIRPIAKPESLCNPSSSVCKHWQHVFVSNATRVPLSGDRGFDTVAGQVDRTDLEGRASHHLFRPQRAGLDQSPDHMAAGPEIFCGFRQRQPFTILLRRPVGVNVAHATHRRDTFRRPGFALTGR